MFFSTLVGLVGQLGSLAAFAQAPDAPPEFLTPPATVRSRDFSDGLESIQPADELSEFRARLDALEQENSTLLEEVRSLQSSQPAAPPKADPFSMSAKWNNGLELKSADKKFRVHVGGRTQLDGVWIDNTSHLAGAGGVLGNDSVNFRRARLRVDGTMYEFIDWAAEFDFANSVNDNVGLQPASEANVSNVPAPTDLWFNFSKLPVIGNFRIGNMKEPLGMEHQTSSRFLEFMERSLNQDAFTGPFNNGFTPGLMAWNLFDQERGTWSTGFFKNTTNPFAFGVGDGEYAWTARLTYLLWDDCDSTEILHVGVSGSLRQTNNGAARYRVRGSLRNGPGALNPLMADTASFLCSEQDLLGLECAWNSGPFSIQSEYIGSWNQDAVGNFGALAGVPLGTALVHGGYIEALYFLTDDHRVYEHERGAFGRIKPKENFAPGRGTGAWQVGARLAHLDLNGDGLLGGQVDDATLGLNWFLNPNMKLQWNYVCTWRDSTRNGVDGAIHGFGMRVAHDY